MSYTGETIDPGQLLDKIREESAKRGFQTIRIARVGGYPIYILKRAGGSKNSKRVYLSAGVHGDEPAPPLTILKMLEENALQPDVDWTIVPMLNPTGFKNNTRENADGIDLNRDFRNSKAKETRALIEFLDREDPFGLSMLLHEDWESQGFYLYQIPLENANEVAKYMIRRVAEVIPIDLQEDIDGMPATGGIIQPNPNDLTVDPKLEGNWPEAFYIYYRKMAKLQFTVESPSAFPMKDRVKALHTALEASFVEVRNLHR
ncbi:MAG: M14 family metallocarboxypeptidase [Opitutales bacterium]|nr:M14 family metallocarboxypeptidase [Opitutales bacterium]